MRIKLAPGASFCGFRNIYTDEHGVEYLKASVTTIAEKGKANKELIKTLAKELKIAKSTVSIISGETDHLKKLFLEIEQTADINDRLLHLKKDE